MRIYGNLKKYEGKYIKYFEIQENDFKDLSKIADIISVIGKQNYYNIFEQIPKGLDNEQKDCYIISEKLDLEIKAAVYQNLNNHYVKFKDYDQWVNIKQKLDSHAASNPDEFTKLKEGYEKRIFELEQQLKYRDKECQILKGHQDNNKKIAYNNESANAKL